MKAMRAIPFYALAWSIVPLAASFGAQAFEPESAVTRVWPNRLQYLHCVQRLGGCVQERDAGFADAAEIADYASKCSSEARYDVAAPAAQGSDLSPAFCATPYDWQARNRGLLERIHSEAASNDLETLARSFEDSRWLDLGTVGSRLDALLLADEAPMIAGLEGRVEFSDVGFRGDQLPGGEGFRDPHPESRDQVGHFLTGVGLAYDPSRVSQEIFGTGFRMRGLLEANEEWSNERVAMQLMVGHERAPDPEGADGLVAKLAAFRRQFHAATESDIANFKAAAVAVARPLGAYAPATGAEKIDLAAGEPFLRAIPINYSWRGNSLQDIRLTMCAWVFGRLVRAGYFASGAQAARWIRANLGP